MPNTIRMVVVTTRPDLSDVIKQGFIRMPEIDMVISVGTLDEAVNKLSRPLANVMLLDLDTVQADAVTLQQLTSRFNLLVILTAASNLRAVSLLKGNIRDFIQKPMLISTANATSYVNTIYKRMESMAKPQMAMHMRDLNRLADGSKKIIVIASSTGGTEALERIIRDLPVDVPPVLVVQHMPSGFTKLFADRLNLLYPLEIKEAKSGDYLKQGQMLLAPADYHMRLVRQSGKLAVDCFIGTKVHGVMPAADVLFESVAEIMRSNAVGVILTGMGADGARGLMLMHKNGAKTIGQNKDTCVVYGMPKVAKDLGALDFDLPLDQIGKKIVALL